MLEAATPAPARPTWDRKRRRVERFIFVLRKGTQKSRQYSQRARGGRTAGAARAKDDRTIHVAISSARFSALDLGGAPHYARGTTRGGQPMSTAKGMGALRVHVSLILAAAAAAPAFAQAPVPDESLDEIVVRGVRLSVESAQQVKRDSLQVVDAVVAEDIGKLPDNNVAEALSRVTGVQINRLRADASATLVRGLPNVVTTLNGREIFTTSGRGIALADIPADLLQKVEVRKSNL